VQSSEDYEERRQSVDSGRSLLPPRLLESRAASHAHFGAWQTPSAASAKDERKIVERVVALEKKLKV
jgi:hypothetical protein